MLTKFICLPGLGFAYFMSMEKALQRRSRVFSVGTVLSITFSLLSGFLNIGTLYLFGLPLAPVLLGLILVWISAEPAKKKALVSLLIVPAVAIGFALFFFSLPQAEPETFLLPGDYRGPFVVLLVEGCGASIPYENGRRIYNIPDSGVLLHSGKYTEGVIDRRFLLIGRDGNRTQLPEFDYSSFDEEANSLKWRFSRKDLTKETLGVFWGYRTYYSFIISNYGELEQQAANEKEGAWKQLQQTIDEELKSKNCRR